MLDVHARFHVPINRVVLQIALVLALVSVTACERRDSTAPTEKPGRGSSPPPMAAEVPASPAALSAAPSSTITHATAIPDDPIDLEYSAVLSTIVNDDGLVRYDLLADDTQRHLAALERVRDSFSKTSLTDSNQHRKAMLLNAYNVHVLVMAARASCVPGFKSVRDVPGFFEQQQVNVEGRSMTLDALTSVLAEFGDPRLHAALVQGARSSPPLLNEPYRASRLDQQLDDQCRRWLDNQSWNRALRTSLGLSEIFKWHEEEFKIAPYDGVLGFVRKFTRPRGTIRDFMVSMPPELRITHLPFDWRLNQAPRDDGPMFSAPPGDSTGASPEAASRPSP